VIHPDRPLLVVRRTSRHVAPTAGGDVATRHAPIGAARNRPSRHSESHGKRIIPSGQDGFTLVELLVVVLVLGALVGIAVPTFVKQREGAWDAAVQSELRAATIALASYRAQNGIYAAPAIATGEGWGYESSPDIRLRHRILDADFCLIAWFDATAEDTQPEAGLTGLPGAGTVLWRATPVGIAPFEPGAPDNPAVCTP
jgi:prepilin-type N-terminal cleavage/methylation domain-containing protein